MNHHYQKLLILVLCFSLYGTANATLLSLDLNTVGDGLITRDSVTGLEWLDLTESIGLSANEVLADIGGFMSSGWTMATFTQVADLFTNAGGTVVLGTFTWTFANTVAAELLLSVMGETQAQFDAVTGNKIVSAGQGWAIAGNGRFDNPFYDRCFQAISTCTSALVGSGLLHVGGDTFSGDLKFSGLGTFLYRESAVPEPTTLALLSLGLFGLGFGRRKRI